MWYAALWKNKWQIIWIMSVVDQQGRLHRAKPVVEAIQLPPPPSGRNPTLEGLVEANRFVTCRRPLRWAGDRQSQDSISLDQADEHRLRTRELSEAARRFEVVRHADNARVVLEPNRLFNEETLMNRV